MRTNRTRYVPRTPAGSLLPQCAARTEEGAWQNLMREAAHMPYPDKAAFVARGYTVEDSFEWVEIFK